MTGPELQMSVILRGMGIDFVSEYKVYKNRKWKVDFAILKNKIIIECEGGTWSGGRHVRGKGFENDCKKYNCCESDNWHVLRYTTSMIKDTPLTIMRQIKKLMEAK